MISREEIVGLARLARLEVEDGEMASLQKDISNILEYVGQISASAQGDALTSGLLKASPYALRNVMRDDVPYEADCVLSGKRDAILAQLPRREGDFAVVRKIIQKDE